jgi:hypothetical protein
LWATPGDGGEWWPGEWASSVFLLCLISKSHLCRGWQEIHGYCGRR